MVSLNAGIHGDVRIEALADGGHGRQRSADFERKTGKDQLPAVGRFDCVCDLCIIVGVDRRTVDDFHPGQSFDQLGNGRSPHAVPGRRSYDDRKLQCLRGFGEADDVMFELGDRVITHSAHEADLVIDEDERGVFGCY